MQQSNVCTFGGLVLVLLGTINAAEASPGLVRPSLQATTLVQPAHSVHAAEQTLYRRGYYDIHVERTSLPYSFSACKRGVRYHIHVDYYGDLVQVDAIGRCNDDYGYSHRYRYDDDGAYGGRRYYGRYRRDGY